MIDSKSAKTKIMQFIFDKFPLAQKKKIGEDSALLEGGLVDSIGILEIVAFIEQEFSVSVSDDDLTPENFASVARVVALVESKTVQSKTVESKIVESKTAELAEL